MAGGNTRRRMRRERRVGRRSRGEVGGVALGVALGVPAPAASSPMPRRLRKATNSSVVRVLPYPGTLPLMERFPDWGWVATRGGGWGG